ncbi:Hemerythrin HHE cation binding domain protein [Kribbella flavida DSM 17836]|uniref:Hemerythrin HHE cation binding domain protein n=1 Tax=Kribbella flavida (strain DSM 17836 / JCM 10339 / NBRC 14399) TaxID=479435 RepID=D2PUC7_KRIFD|nr:hemerythrin domain-containing protein [Kribbella flavida]ADB35178.1 Hemerythrin HHE cation binding domain protein [Kribbella flavida DSM 17836]
MNASQPDTAHDVIDVLTADHREFEQLIVQITDGPTPTARRETADVLIAELVRHAVAEEMFVYPAIREHLPNGDQVVEHDKQEHHELEVLMKRLEGLDAADPKFLVVVGELEGVLRDHVLDEEGEQFPLLRANIPADRLVSLKDRVETAKKAAPTRPHPGAPNSKLFHLVAGPGVGMVDRLRDRLSGRSTSTD